MSVISESKVLVNISVTVNCSLAFSPFDYVPIVIAKEA